MILGCKLSLSPWEDNYFKVPLTATGLSFLLVQCCVQSLHFWLMVDGLGISHSEAALISSRSASFISFNWLDIRKWTLRAWFERQLLKRSSNSLIKQSKNGKKTTFRQYSNIRVCFNICISKTSRKFVFSVRSNFPQLIRQGGDTRVAIYDIYPPRWNPPWRGEGAYLTKSFQSEHQQEELVGAMLLCSIRTNRSS